MGERGSVIKAFRQQSTAISNDVQDAEAASNAKLRAAIAGKHAEFQEQDRVIADFEKTIHAMKEELADIESDVTFFTAYRDKEQHDFAKQIEALKSAIEDEKRSFEDEKEDVQFRFERSKQMTAAQADQLMNETRRRAGEFALRKQSIKDKVLVTLLRVCVHFFLFDFLTVNKLIYSLILAAGLVGHAVHAG